MGKGANSRKATESTKTEIQLELFFGKQPKDRDEFESEMVFEARRLIKKAEGFYGITVPLNNVDFSLKGKCAGQAVFVRVDKSTIGGKLRFNVPLAIENWDDFFTNTIPHEVAHLVVATKWGRRAKAHGREWQRVMRECFQIEPSRCHSYDVSGHIQKRHSRRFVYACACQEFRLTAIRHNKIRKGAVFGCSACKEKLKFIRED